MPEPGTVERCFPYPPNPPSPSFMAPQQNTYNQNYYNSCDLSSLFTYRKTSTNIYYTGCTSNAFHFLSHVSMAYFRGRWGPR